MKEVQRPTNESHKTLQSSVICVSYCKIDCYLRVQCGITLNTGCYRMLQIPVLAKVLLLHRGITVGAGDSLNNKLVMKGSHWLWVDDFKWKSHWTLFLWWLSHAPAPWLILLVRHPTTSSHSIVHLFATAVVVWPYNRSYIWHICITRIQGEKDVCVIFLLKCLCGWHCVREIEKKTWKERKKKARVQEGWIQRASVCSPRLSITLDSQGPFRIALNHGLALPAHRLQAQDKLTTELHPVCPSSTVHSVVTMGHSSRFTLQEDPVCQSSSDCQRVNEIAF